MRSLFVILTLALFSTKIVDFVHADEGDEELQRFSDKLSTELKASGRKKIAVLDFLDLQGRPLEIGRYVSEQLTVDLVSAKSGFTVVDRANLKSILAEHKLTATGLVDPENARKLGQVSGVDALVLGTATTLGDGIQLTAKVITTDTAEIVAATRSKLHLTQELKTLIENASSVQVRDPGEPKSNSQGTINKGANDSTNPRGQSLPDAVNRQTIEPLEIIVTAFNINAAGQNPTAAVAFTLSNIGTKAVAIDFPKGAFQSTLLMNKHGDSIEEESIVGIDTNGDITRSDGHATVIGPGKSARCIFRYGVWRNRGIVQFPPFQMQLSLNVADVVGGANLNVRKLEFLVDLK